MAVIPQITNPFQGKGYQSSLNNQNRPGGEQFEIIQLTKTREAPGPLERETERNAGRGLPNRTDLPQLMVKTAKDPSMAVETLKQLISTELLATASASGHTELHGELEGLSKSIYLAVTELVREIINQEEQTTMFSGHRLFDLLREESANSSLIANTVLQQTDEDKLNAIANFLKAVNFTFNRGEILNAISANLKFLSTYFSPSPKLSEKLAALSESWAGNQARENFGLLKGETVKLLQNVSESLLNNEKTQVLIPLIIHNLSRYNTNDYMLKDAFSSLLIHIPHAQKGAFMAAFDDFLNAVLYGEFKPALQAAQNPQNQQTAVAEKELSDLNEVKAESAESKDTEKSPQQKNEFPPLYSRKLGEEGWEFPPKTMTRDSLADGLRGFLLGRINGKEAITLILSNLIEEMRDVNLMNALRSDLSKIDSITAMVDYLNDVLQQLPDAPERQFMFEMLSETVSGMAEKGELPPDSAPPSTQNAENSGNTANTGNPTQTSAPQNSSENVSHNSGTENAPGNSAQSTLPENTHHASTAGNTPLPDFTPEKLVEVVSTGVSDLPEAANPEQSNQEKPAEQAAPVGSALEELTSFIQRNINHSALKTLDSYNASNLLQSLINAPGVYTPLSHFIIPLQIGDARAFGELWVDNEDKGGGAASPQDRNHHLFLTFEIESVGRFETDLYAHGTQVSLAVLHPAGFSGEMRELKEKINRIIASTDYTVKEFQTGVLREPHDLTQIFPRISEKRTGLDIVV
ncbi:MAG: hypothetical protein FWG83_03335 [Oscillospiraceae bacterium]|nr:hypothetical protein [Oscillospiraceae bacterium]